MTAAERFRTGVFFVLCSVAIYAWHDGRNQALTILDVLVHSGLLLLALALLVPRETYRATLDFLSGVLRPRGKDGTP